MFEAQKGVEQLKDSVCGGLDNGLNKLKSSLAGTTNETAKLNAAMKKVGGIDNLGDATEDLTLLNKKIEVQQGLCDNLAKEHKKVAAEMGSESTEALKLQKRFLEQTDALTKMKRESKSLSGAIDTVTEHAEKLEKPIDNSTKGSNKLKNVLKNVAAVSLNGVVAGLRKIDGKLSSVAKKAAGATLSSLKKIAGISFKATAAGLAATMIAVTALGGAAIQTGKEFDAGMSTVQALSSATGDELNSLREKAKELGATTAFTATEAAEAMQYMAMAGWKSSDMLNGIDGVMNLAAAAGADLATTSDIVTDGLTAFGMSAKESTRFADVLAATATSANTNVEMMGETFKMVGATAGAMKYSIEDVSLATGLMANAGIKATNSGTALRSFITRLAKPTKESKTAMDKLGISLTNSDGSMKSFKKIIQETRKSMAGLTETEKSSYAAMLAGKTGMSGLLAIVNTSNKDFNSLAKSIENATGAAENMAAIKLDNLEGDITLLKSAWQGFQTELFDNKSSALRGIVKKITSYVDRLNKAFKKGGFDGLIDEVGNILSDIVGEIASKAPEFVSVAGNILNKIVSAFVKNVPQLAKGLASIMITLAQSIRQNAGVFLTAAKEIATELIAALYEAITGQPMGEDTFNSLKQTIDNAFSSVRKIISGVISFGATLTTQLAPVLFLIGGLALSAFGFIADNLDVILPIVTALVAAFLAYKAVMTAVNIITTIVTTAQSIMATVTGTASATTAAGTAAVGTAAATSAPQILAFGAAILMVGVAILAICVGFALLAQSAIAIANAGWGAIAVMAAMIVVIAGLAVGAAILGPVLTAGAIGFIAFGAAVLMVGAGFALLGVGAMLAAVALTLIANTLSAFVSNGIQAALCLTAFSVSMLAFSASASITAISCVALAAGLLALTAVLAVLAVTAVIFAASMATIAVSAVVITATLNAMASMLWQLPTLFLLLTPVVLGFAATMFPLVEAITLVTVPVVAFAVALIPLTGLFGSLSISALLFLVAISRLSAAFGTVNTSQKVFAVNSKKLPAMFIGCVSALLAQSNEMLSGFSKNSNELVVVIMATMLRLCSIVSSVNLYNSGVNIMLGLNKGLTDTSSTVLKTAARLAKAISDTINKTLDIHSPSGVTEDSGYFTGMGSVVGMQKSIPKVQSTSAELGQVMAEGMSLGGYTPENSPTTTNTSNTENNTYSPQFVLNIYGSADKTIESKVKKWIKEALEESYADMSEYAVQEV